jgi:membrane-bound lytic murein transglycosylase B
VRVSPSSPLRTALISILGMLFAGAPLFAYSNCRFKVEAYETLCEKAVNEGVTVDYANRYLLDAQTKARDLKSLELFSPKMIGVHHANEKRANNALIAFVPEIVQNLHRYRAVYDEAEKRFHVNREVIAAILAKETRLGRIGSEHDAFTVFNTLLRELPPDTARNKKLIGMAERNIVSLMRFCFENGIAPGACRYRSSYAGAVGIPQFMPQNFRLVESYGKGAGNLEKMEDAILSTARFLHENAGFDTLIDWDRFPDMAAVENAWYDFDFANANASFAYARSRSGKAYRCYACGKKELAYVARYVKKIMRYNNSSHYAVGVLRLAYDAHQAR